jgi:hypothetical protein
MKKNLCYKSSSAVSLSHVRLFFVTLGNHVDDRLSHVGLGHSRQSHVRLGHVGLDHVSSDKVKYMLHTVL